MAEISFALLAAFENETSIRSIAARLSMPEEVVRERMQAALFHLDTEIEALPALR